MSEFDTGCFILIAQVSVHECIITVAVCCCAWPCVALTRCTHAQRLKERVNVCVAVCITVNVCVAVCITVRGTFEETCQSV